MNRISISVIVPVYNVENYIDKCIDSILRQTYRDFELILINDGSTDSSYEHILRYVHDNRVTVINKPNSGQSDCRYQGLLKSTGDYIYYVDSDDTIEKNALEVFVDDVRKYKSDIVFGRYRLVDESGRELRRQSLYNVNVLQNMEHIIKDSLCVNNFKASLCLKLIKKSLLLNCYNDLVRSIHINEDILLSFLLSTSCNKVTFRNEVIYNVLQRNNSLTRNIKPELITTSDVIYREIAKVLKEETLFDGMKSEYYGGYIKNLFYALAVAATHIKSYSPFYSLYKMIDQTSIYYSEDLKKNLWLIPLKFRALYYIGKSPRLFFLIMRLYRNFLQY